MTGTTFVGFVFLGLDMGAIFQGLLDTRFFLHNDMRIDGRMDVEDEEGTQLTAWLR